MTERSPIRFHGIDHVVLNVTNIERSLKFYRDVLGLKLERIIEDVGIYQLRCGRNLIDLQVLPAGRHLAEKNARGIEHLCLLMAGDFNAVLTHLETQAVPIAGGPTELYGATGFGTSIYILDPDLHTIELKADHAEHPLRTTAQAAMADLTRPAPKSQS